MDEFGSARAAFSVFDSDGSNSLSSQAPFPPGKATGFTVKNREKWWFFEVFTCFYHENMEKPMVKPKGFRLYHENGGLNHEELQKHGGNVV